MAKKSVKNKVSTPNKTTSSPIHPVLQRTLGYCLQKAAFRSRALMDAALEPYGLLTYQFAIMHLLKHVKSCSQVEMGNELSIDKASIVRFLDSLENEGFIQRTPSKEDRRVKNIALTSKGVKMYEIAEKLRDKVQEEFLSPLTTEERKAYSVIIPKLIKTY